MVKSAYVALHVQRCPRLFHLLLFVMHWGRRRRLNGGSKSCFLTDERLATLFITFCEKSGFISEVQFFCKILERVFRRPKRFRDISRKAGLPTLSNTKISLAVAWWLWAANYLVKSIFEPTPKSLFWAVSALNSLLKKPFWFTSQVEGKFETHFR